MILGRRARIIQKNGVVITYTHVSHFQTIMINNEPALSISGETDDVAGGRVNTHDRFLIKDLIDFQIEFRYTPI